VVTQRCQRWQPPASQPRSQPRSAVKTADQQLPSGRGGGIQAVYTPVWKGYTPGPVWSRPESRHATPQLRERPRSSRRCCQMCCQIRAFGAGNLCPAPNRVGGKAPKAPDMAPLPPRPVGVLSRDAKGSAPAARPAADQSFGTGANWRERRLKNGCADSTIHLIFAVIVFVINVI